jgi:hypothetical protein
MSATEKQRRWRARRRGRPLQVDAVPLRRAIDEVLAAFAQPMSDAERVERIGWARRYLIAVLEGRPPRGNSLLRRLR